MNQPRARRPRVRLIEPSLVADYLPREKTGEIRWWTQYRVTYPNGGKAVLVVSTWEGLILSEEKLVYGIVDKKDTLIRLEIFSSVHAVMATIRGLRRPVMPSLFISRLHQSPGAKKWVRRCDRAQTGRLGSARTVFTPGQLAAA